MGTVTSYSFEGGNGATLAGTGITLNGSGAAVHATSEAVVGGTGAKFTANNGATRSARCTVVSHKTQKISAILRTPTVVPGSGVFYQIAQGKSASGNIFFVEYNSAQKIDIYEVAGTIRNNIGAGTVAPGTQFRLSGLIAIGSGTADSNATWKIYSSASNWETQNGATLTRTGVNMGTAALEAIEVGALTAVTPGLVVGADWLQAEDGGTTEFGGPPAAGPPAASASASDQYPLVGVSIELRSTGSTAGSGTLTGYAWTCTAFPVGASSPSISNPNTATASVIHTTAGRYTYQLVVTQTGGLTDTTTLTVYVAPLSADDVKVYSVTAGLWTNEGGAASILAAVNDSNPATSAQSPTNPTGQELRCVMNPYGPGSISVFVAGLWTGGSLTRTVEVFMEDGVTLLTSQTYALTSVEIEREIILDAGDLAQASPGANRRALVVAIADA